MQIYKKFAHCMHSYRSALRIFMLALCVSTATLAVNGQSKTISLNVKNEPIEQVFKNIEKQTGYSFAYNQTYFVNAKKITLNLTNATLDAALTRLLTGTGYSFKVVNNRIYLNQSKKEGKPVVEKKVLTAATPAAKKEEVVTYSSLAQINEESNNDTQVEEQAAPTLPVYQPLEVTSQKNETILHPVLTATNTITDPISLLSAYTSKPKLHRLAIKSNLLSDLTTTFNLSMELRISRKYTLDIPVSVNPFQFKEETKQFRHLLVQPELRYWICEPFNKNFVGLHLHYASFNVGGIGLTDYMKNNRFEGSLYGAGISYGHQWYLSPRWSLEATFGVGYAYIDYERYNCTTCGKKMGDDTHHYFGPTKAGISLIYMIK